MSSARISREVLDTGCSAPGAGPGATRPVPSGPSGLYWMVREPALLCQVWRVVQLLEKTPILIV